MGATTAIVKKEFTDFLSSPKFWIVFMIFVLMVVLAAFQGVRSYEKELEMYGEILRKSEEIKSKTGGELPPHFTLSVPKPTMLSAFEALTDSISVVGALLSLILGYGAISGERKKTLKVLLSYPVYRDSVINAKFISRVLAIAIALLFTLAVSTGIIISLLNITPSVDEITRILLFAFSSVVYMIFFLSVGISLSIPTKEDSTSLYACLMFWLISAVLISRIAFFVSGMLVPLPPAGSIDAEEKKEFLMQRLDVANTVRSFSPSYHFLRFSGYMLSPYRTKEIFSKSYAPLPLSQSLAYSWHNISLLLIGATLLFIASYIKFMREDL